MAEPSPALPLRACLLSGGESRRMGRDKALLPHPAGGTWLEQSLLRLIELERLQERQSPLPITVFSRHRAHQELCEQLARRLRRDQRPDAPTWPAIVALAEPPPWEGPLLALHRLMQLHPDQRLLLCPVDMPDLSAAVLLQLLAAAEAKPAAIHLAHDGQRLQPLLGVVPSDEGHRADLEAAINGGERRLQSWLAGQACRAVRLDPLALRNLNRPEDLARLSRAAARAPAAGADHRVPPAAPTDSAPGRGDPPPPAG